MVVHRISIFISFSVMVEASRSAWNHTETAPLCTNSKKVPFNAAVKYVKQDIARCKSDNFS